MSQTPDDAQGAISSPRAASLPESEVEMAEPRDSQSPPPSKPTTAEWTFSSLLSVSSNFKPVDRVSASASAEEISKLVADYEHRGIPLILEGWHLKEGWKSEIHTPHWLAEKFVEGMYRLFELCSTHPINFTFLHSPAYFEYLRTGRKEDDHRRTC